MIRSSVFAALLALAALPAFAEAGMTVTVPTAVNGRFVQAQYARVYGCTGGNISPQIVWSDPPAATRSFAVTLFDPDAPGGHGWWHWLAVDIPPSVRELPKGANGDRALMPKGVIQTMTDFGAPGYGGPCPPPGEDHHYVVTVTALKTASLGLTPQAKEDEVAAKIKANELAHASVIIRAAR